MPAAPATSIALSAAGLAPTQLANVPAIARKTCNSADRRGFQGPSARRSHVTLADLLRSPLVVPSTSQRTTMTPVAAALLDAIRQRRVRAGVVGLGYVGLPLAVEFARAGIRTTGIDLNTEKVATIMEGRSYIDDVPS